MRKETIRKYVASACPLNFDSGKKAGLYSSTRLVYLMTRYPELAADTILHREMAGNLYKVVNSALIFIETRRGQGALISNSWEKACQTFIEIIFNLVGMESKRVGFSDEETKRTLQNIENALGRWEKTKEGYSVLKTAIENVLRNMELVNKGNSLAAKMAENIKKEIDKNCLALSFIIAAKSEIQSNIYYQMVARGMSKFGNDSATGLRTVRHLDFVQVSSNPVIAAKAYEEFPGLWDDFKEIIKINPQWQENPEKYGDEIALHGTITSLLPSLLIFRPIALLSDFHDGLVSYQLNPFKATDARASIKDAEKICSILAKILYHYDAWLGWDPDKTQGRPNIVFKVAACHPAAISITTGLNRRGIGSNDTVTYSVAQEIRLLLAEAEGMARALKKGILPVQVYQTNMIGRTEDHLRESEAERLVAKLKLNRNEFAKLAEAIAPEARGTREEITKIICARKQLPSLLDQKFAAFFPGEDIDWLEHDIRFSGIYVTRKVYQLFFGPENQAKLKVYLQKKFDLTKKEAELILDRIDMLPASKRRSDDTYQVLGMPNVTNTEFPNHQLVVCAAQEDYFDLELYRDSIKMEPNPGTLKRLLKIEDFVRVYELTPALAKKLKKIGINTDNVGVRGMNPEDWPNYGAVQKTMTEFKNAYLDFKQKAIEFAKK